MKAHWATVTKRAAAVGMLGLMALSGNIVAGQTASEVIARYPLPEVALADAQALALPGSPIADDRGILLGGVGSDLWRAAGDPEGEFWMITDRGPNYDIEVEGEDRLAFPAPDFTPHILHVRVGDAGIEILEAIAIVGASGAPVTGISNIDGHDVQPYDVSGTVALDYNINGVDSEGLVRAPDGTFYVAEEYGPSILHIDATGVVLHRFVPEGLDYSGADTTVVASLPAVLGERRGNRGFEGIAISNDGSTVYAMVQSPLANPDGDTSKGSRNVRILAIDAATGAPLGESVYQFDEATAFDPDPEVERGDMKSSGLVFIDADTMLVLERTDAVAKVYVIELAGATNILGGAYDDVATSPSLEAVDDLASIEVVPVAKTLLVDLSAVGEMPEKIEGIAIVDATTIAIANDNDFDTGEFDADGRNVGSGKSSEIILVSVPALPVE